MSGLFWLNDKQWAKLEPLLSVDTRGRRVDDRRIISGIIHTLEVGRARGRCVSFPRFYRHFLTSNWKLFERQRAQQA